MFKPSPKGTLGNRSGLPSIAPGSRQIPADFLNAIGRAIDQARIIPGNAFSHFETPGGTYLEPTENGREYLHPFYIQSLGTKPGHSDKALIAMTEGRVLGRADAERGYWEDEPIRGYEFQTSLGIYGLWASVPNDGLPAGNRTTDDLSIVKPGTGVGITKLDAIEDSPYLVQSNAPIYEIDISSAWRLLAVKAVGSDSDETPKGWEFEIVNLLVTDVLKYYTPGQPEYDPPRIVDVSKMTVRGDTDNMPTNVNLDMGGQKSYPQSLDGFTQEILPVETVGGPVVLDSSNVARPLVLKYQYRYALHRLVEIGTYFLPIAYIRQGSKGLEIQQVARSDFHFWPVPRMHTWSKWAEPTELTFGDTVLPSPPP